MQEHSFSVGEKDNGLRLDKFLVAYLPSGQSREFIQRLIKGSCVLVDGRPEKPHHAVKTGEAIKVSIPEREPSKITPEDIPLDIVYEDDDLLVVNKPSGLVVHPAPGNYSGTLVNALLYHRKKLSGSGDEMRPGIVHRLDKGSSGLLVVAKNEDTHRELAKQFKLRSVKRTYIALVKGTIQLDNGIIELPIGRDRRDRKKMSVVFSGSKNAVTTYRVLRRFKDFTLLELKLNTGRTHQIRVHMAYLGHPILGDDKYGAKSALGRPALHAKTLGFLHPRTREYMEFDSRVPKEIQGIIDKGR